MNLDNERNQRFVISQWHEFSNLHITGIMFYAIIRQSRWSTAAIDTHYNGIDSIVFAPSITATINHHLIAKQ